MKLDISDAFLTTGLVLMVAGLVIVHPAWLLVAIGYLAYQHGIDRSR